MSSEPSPAQAIPDVAGFRLDVSVDAEVATITLNQPDIRNAQNPLTWAAMLVAVNALPGTVRVLVVRGEGKSFSAGLDRRMLSPDGIPGVKNLAELAGTSESAATTEIAGFQEAFGVFSRPGLVTVALVQGHAVGAGFQLALACDIRIATEDAQFTMAEVNLGLVPDLGGTKRLIELVGYSRTAAICLTGARVSASEAFQMGLVAAVVPADQLEVAGAQFVDRIRQLPRTAVTEIKALLLQAADRTQAEQERAEREAQYRQLRLLAGYEAEDGEPASPPIGRPSSTAGYEAEDGESADPPIGRPSSAAGYEAEDGDPARSETTHSVGS